MKTVQNYTVKENSMLCPDIFRMVLTGDTSWIKNPGMFMNIAVPGFYLRRPISICDWNSDSLVLVYKKIGNGTACLSDMKQGAVLECITGLGNGFDLSLAEKETVLIGGGVGIPPLVGCARMLKKMGIDVTAVLGYADASMMFLQEEFEKYAVHTYIATMDGSAGIKGTAVDVLKQKELQNMYYMTVGPMGMLQAVHQTMHNGQLSFEERMGCGFGACMGCTHKTKNGYKRICTEGPVLNAEEVLW